MRRNLLLRLLAISVGLAVGLGVFTFMYARGASYLTDDPRACLNCHIMRAEYDGWVKASHRNAAVCNDCHTPDGLLPKYLSKAYNGALHSAAFTSGRFPDVIQLKPYTRAITERACLTCHADLVHAIDIRGREQVSCLRCHHNVGHQ